MSRIPLAVSFLTLAVLACGDPTGVNADEFPALPVGMIQNLCIRGNRSPADEIRGSIASSDCALEDGSRFEMWRVRVGKTQNYRIAVMSEFDNVLVVLRIESYSSENAAFAPLASDDDSGPDLNALISSVALNEGLDYLVIIGGYDSSEMGPYTIAITPSSRSASVAGPEASAKAAWRGAETSWKLAPSR